MSEAVDLLVKDCALTVIKFEPFSYILCEDSSGFRIRLKLYEGANGLAAFDYKGARYYVKRRFDLPHSGDYLVYRVCGDKLLYFGLGNLVDEVLAIEELVENRYFIAYKG